MRKEKLLRLAIEWLSAFEQYITLDHAENNGEYKIKLEIPTLYWKKWLAIDGYCESLKLCFEFDGCLFHGCDNKKCRHYKQQVNPFSGKQMKDIRERSRSKHKLIRELGYRLVVIQECKYIEMKKRGSIESYVLDILVNEQAYNCW